MTDNQCGIVRDLLPLYIESACGRESNELVRSHLEQCEKCKKLHGQMAKNLLLVNEEYDSWAAFKKTFWVILWIVLAAVAMLLCYTTNAGLAWWGGEVIGTHLAATVLYVVFWGVLTVLTANIRLLARFNFWASVLSLCASAICAMCRLLNAGGFLLGSLLAPTVAVPMQGVMMFTDYTGLYCISVGICTVWVIFTAWNLRRLKRVWGK